MPGSPDGGSASDSGSAEPGASGEEAPEWPADEPDDGSASANDDAEDSGSADDDASSDSEKDPAEDDSVESGGSEEASGSHEQAQNMSAPAKADGWQVDPYQLRAFGDAVLRARSYLETVRAKVDLMQGAELTPQLGTSPVGTQLAKKFDDRLNSADGLRARLAEAMTRMEQLVASAEKAASSYEELEETSVQSYGNVEVKNG